jgi:hypothetical protein
MNIRTIFSGIFLLITFTKGYSQLGMWSFGDTISIDETEVLIGEWIDYVIFRDLTRFPNYVRMEELSEVEKKAIIEKAYDLKYLPQDQNSLEFLKQIIAINDTGCIEIRKLIYIDGTFHVPIKCDRFITKEGKQKLNALMHTPVTGITYKQALEYCKWRTTLDSIRFFDQNYKVAKPMSRVNGSYSYSLLTPTEYDTFIPLCDSLTEDKQYSNYNYSNSLPPKKDKYAIIGKSYGNSLLDAGSYHFHFKKYSKLYDLLGNAAEMTSVEGVSKGGSYIHSARDGQKGKVIYYIKPESWLGFRCCARKR